MRRALTFLGTTLAPTVQAGDTISPCQRLVIGMKRKPLQSPDVEIVDHSPRCALVGMPKHRPTGPRNSTALLAGTSAR
jgi:hypothetical protein